MLELLELEGQHSWVVQVDKEQTLSHFLGNINSRGVRNGKFVLKYEGKANKPCNRQEMNGLEDR